MPLSTPTTKFGAMITTVDPTINLIEGVLKTGKAVQIEMHNIPPLFRWPQVGESWMVRQENGLWYLDGAWRDVFAPTSIHDADPGSVIITTPTGRIHVIGSSDGSTDFDITRPLTPLPMSEDYVASPYDLVLMTGAFTVTMPHGKDGMQVGVVALAGDVTVDPNSMATLYVGTSSGLTSTTVTSGTTLVFIFYENVWYALKGPSSGGGGGGDLNYHFNQGSPSATWTVNHGLNKYPSVTVVSSGGDTVEAPITYLSSNSLRLNFTAAFAGDAYLN